MDTFCVSCQSTNRRSAVSSSTILLARFSYWSLPPFSTATKVRPSRSWSSMPGPPNRTTVRYALNSPCGPSPIRVHSDAAAYTVAALPDALTAMAET